MKSKDRNVEGSMNLMNFKEYFHFPNHEKKVLRMDRVSFEYLLLVEKENRFVHVIEPS